MHHFYKHMLRIFYQLFLLLFFCCPILEGQFIGDTLKDTKEAHKLSFTKPISGPYVKVFESIFLLKVNRQDLLKKMKGHLVNDNNDKELKSILQNVFDSISSADSITFTDLWLTSNKLLGDSKNDMKRFENLALKKTLIKEVICELIEQGKFQLFKTHEEIKTYYFSMEVCDYGTANCVFTGNDILFWICPPYEIE